MPSGENAGQDSRDSSGVSRAAVPPAVGAIQTESFHSNTNRVPSALTLGLDPRKISDQSLASPPQTAHAALRKGTRNANRGHLIVLPHPTRAILPVWMDS